MSRSIAPGVVTIAAFMLSAATSQAMILSEDFEGALDPRISISTVGTPNPGVKARTEFGSTMAFGFGYSTCGANCFFDHVTTLTITFDTPTYVGEVSFKEMELFDNWGSDGAVFYDGSPFGDGFRDFGRLPYNDRTPDSTFRNHLFAINSTVSTIDLRVSDITNLSEINIDDLVVTPEPSSALLLGFGLLGLAVRAAEGVSVRRRSPTRMRRCS